MNRKILTALAVLSLSAAVGGTLAAPSYAQPAPSQTTPIAFQGPPNANCPLSLWTWKGLPSESSSDASPGFSPSCFGVASGTSPSEVALANGETAIAFQGTNGDLVTWIGYPGRTGTAVDQDLGMAQGTSPSITVMANGEDAVAFQANNGVLWTWTGNPGKGGLYLNQVREGVASRHGRAAIAGAGDRSGRGGRRPPGRGLT
ncbi:MAG: hypothetical protein ACLP01_33045, partial [Solirubrobacteraceae bacterium]